MDSLSMRIPTGAIYGFVGKNGAGKTTLIRLLCGLQSPSGGSYSLFGTLHTEKEIAKARRRIGAMVEAPAVYPDMTAMENMQQQYRVLGATSFSGANDLLRLVGLKDAGNKKHGIFHRACGKSLGSLWRWPGNRTFLCWTNR